MQTTFAMETLPLYNRYEEGRCFDNWLVRRLSWNLWDFARNNAKEGKVILDENFVQGLKTEVITSLAQYTEEAKYEMEVWGE